MNKDILINLRTSKELKEDFQTIVEQEGFTMSQVLEASMKDIVKRRMVPINIRSKIERKRETVLTIPFIKTTLENAIYKCGAYKVLNVYLFGSYARGTARPSSDIDFFVETENGFSLFDMAELIAELEKRLGKKVDFVTQKDDKVFFNHVVRERIQLYERRP